MPGCARKMSFFLGTIFLLLGNTCSGLGDPVGTEWWENTLIYEISPSAYQDSDGDGRGDLQGILSRLDYIQDLGVETICLNPIYPSPLVDSGYDVSDYKNINPVFGNLSDFDELLEEAHERDMKVILDVVPTRSSDQHEWFNASIYRIDPYTDYYIWANGTVMDNGTMVPPDNRTSARDDEDSAWTWNDERDQWYRHEFHESEPDLQLQNEDVRREIILALEFWLDRGVDGFRLSGVPDPSEDTDLPASNDAQLLYEIRELVDEWTASTNSTSKLLVAGNCNTEASSLSYYYEGNASPIMPLNCRLIIDIDMTGNGNASQIEAKIEEWLDLVPSNASTNWVLSNNGHSRVASRVGADRLDALHMLSMLLPGQAFTYYGDEIGMLDAPISFNELDDTTHTPYAEMTRRNSVTNPMQWNDTISGGFSTSEDTYLPVNDDYLDLNVEDQLENPRSHLNVYKTLARLRKEPVFVRGSWELESLNDDAVLVLRRTLTDHPVYVVVINLTDDEQIVNMTMLYPDLSDYLDVVVASSNDVTNRSAVRRDAIGILPDAGLVLRTQEDDDNSTGSSGDVDMKIEEETTTDYYTEATTLFDYDQENITEEIETTTVSFDETTLSNVPLIPASTTQVPSDITTITSEPSPSSGSSNPTCTTLQFQLIVGFAITSVVRAW